MNRKILAAAALLPVLPALFVAQTVLYSRNVPIQHPEWVNGKGMLARGIMGSPQISLYRQALRNNRLHLDAWHGFNEFLFHLPHALGEVRFRFRLDRGAHLSVIFNKTADGFSGARFSRLSEFPSMTFRAEPSGKFVETRPFEEPMVDAGWHEASVRAVSAGIEITLDGRPMDTIEETGLPMQVVGFRAGKADAAVDDVRIQNRGGRVLMVEDFENDRHLPRTWLFFYAALAAPTLAWIVIASGGDDRRPLFQAALVHILLAVVTLIYLGWDRLFWSRRYPFSRNPEIVSVRLQEHRFESARIAAAGWFSFLDPDRSVHPGMENMREFLGLADTWDRLSPERQVNQVAHGVDLAIIGADDDPAALAKVKDVARKKKATVIYFLGGSQMFGTGALFVEDRIPVVVQRLLTDASRGRRAFVTVNLARSGEGANELAPRYLAAVSVLKPDITVYDMGHNDPNPSDFSVNLRRMVESDRRLGVRSLLLLEPNSLEYQRPFLADQFRLMQWVAGRTGAAVANLDAHMNAPDVRDTGFLWWDGVHMTSHGMSLAGEFIARKLAEMEMTRKPGKSVRTPAGRSSRAGGATR